MALDVSMHGVIQRRNDLQARLWGTRHRAMSGNHRNATAKELHREILRYLIKATDQRLLEGSQTTVRANVKFIERPSGFEIMVGDVRNFHRDPALPHFRRKRDQAWFDFQLLGVKKERRIEIEAYDFELRLAKPELFIRFDLNPPGHENDEHGLRSHMHLDSDDDGMAVPAPVMSPFELLDIMVHGLIQTGRQRHRGALAVPVEPP